MREHVARFKGCPGPHTAVIIRTELLVPTISRSCKYAPRYARPCSHGCCHFDHFTVRVGNLKHYTTPHQRGTSRVLEWRSVRSFFIVFQSWLRVLYTVSCMIHNPCSASGGMKLEVQSQDVDLSRCTRSSNGTTPGAPMVYSR